MKYLYAFIIFFFASFAMADDAGLLIKCPDNCKITLNGYSQKPENRLFTFDVPTNAETNVKVLCTVGNDVIYDKTVVLTGGVRSILDLLPKEEKKPEVKPEKKEAKPNFSIFKNTPIVSRPNFGTIKDVEKKIEKKTENKPEKEIKTEVAREAVIVSPSFNANGTCTTGNCSGGR